MPVSLVPVDSPHLIWPVVESALERVKQKTRAKWTTDFVFNRVMSGNAGLFRFVENGQHLGWMVVERYDQGEVWMNVWVLEGKGLERADECMPLIDLLARQIGATSWQCTGRKGWQAIGLKPVATVYERKLT